MPSNLIDAKRNPRTSYRILGGYINDGEQLYEITTYPKPPEPISQNSFFRFDVLPEWMQDCMRILDVAGDGVRVDGIGAKFGTVTYWLDSVDVKHHGNIDPAAR